MKRLSLVAIIWILVAPISAPAAPNPRTAKAPAFPGILANARYVYVASYDGDQFDTNLLPEDRDAIGAVQAAFQNWGKLMIVYRALRSRHHHPRDQPTFRRSAGRVRCARGAEW
jgi:hypothetical protein